VVPVGGRLHDLGVQAGGGVVDEHPLPDQAQVDPALHRLAEGVQGPGHVLAVQAQVHGQVVAGAGGDADEPDVVAGGDAGDQGLGAVAAGHAEDVGATGHGVLGELEQVVAGLEEDRDDAAPVGLGDQVEALDLAAARPGVHEQDRPGRRPDRRPRGRAALQRLDVPPEGVPGRHPADQDQGHHQAEHQQPTRGGEDEHDRRPEGEHRQHHRQGAPDPGPGHGVGGRAHPQAHAHHRQRQLQRPRDQGHGDHGDHGQRGQQRHHRAHPAPERHRLRHLPSIADAGILAGSGERDKPLPAGFDGPGDPVGS
jgi:hypothetical protein